MDMQTNEEKYQAALVFLGSRWLLHPSHSPQKKDYSGWPKGLHNKNNVSSIRVQTHKKTEHTP